MLFSHSSCGYIFCLIVVQSRFLIGKLQFETWHEARVSTVYCILCNSAGQSALSYRNNCKLINSTILYVRRRMTITLGRTNPEWRLTMIFILVGRQATVYLTEYYNNNSKWTNERATQQTPHPQSATKKDTKLHCRYKLVHLLSN